MRCLIPVTQEQYSENAMSRAERLCDEVILLYVVDRRLIEKVEVESSYILPSYALESVEDLVVNIHRKEAEKLKERIKGTPVELRFLVGDFYQTLEREVIRSEPDLIMVDEFHQGFLRYNVPLWIDNGTKVDECTVIIKSISRIRRIHRGLNLIKEVCRRLSATCYIYYPPGDAEGIKSVKEFGDIINKPRGHIVTFREWNKRYTKDILLII